MDELHIEEDERDVRSPHGGETMTQPNQSISSLGQSLATQPVTSAAAAQTGPNTDASFSNELTTATQTSSGADTSTTDTSALQNRETAMAAAQWLAMMTLESLSVPGESLGAASTSNPLSSLTGSSALDSLSSLTDSSNPFSSLSATGLGNTGMDTSALSELSQLLPILESMQPQSAATHSTASAGPSSSTSSLSQGDIAAAIQQASSTYGVPASLIQAVIQQESGGNPNAVSAAGAIGMMQLMPSTATSLGVSNPCDPVQNIDGGTKYLSELLNTFGGDTSLALAAYNAGPNAVKTYHGIPPYPETQQYVQSILGMMNQETNALKKLSLASQTPSGQLFFRTRDLSLNVREWRPPPSSCLHGRQD